MTWGKYLPGNAALLDRLPEDIDKPKVSAFFGSATDGQSILEAFVVAMIWGHGRSGYGAWRTARVLNNCPDASARLLAAHELARRSPIDAYSAMGYQHACNLKYLGPAFGTKFIFFAAASNGHRAAILDALTAEWVRRFTDGLTQFSPASWRPTEYRRYLELMEDWSAQIGEPVSTIEWLMFADSARNLRRTKGSNQWSESWVPALDL